MTWREHLKELWLKIKRHLVVLVKKNKKEIKAIADSFIDEAFAELDEQIAKNIRKVVKNELLALIIIQAIDYKTDEGQEKIKAVIGGLILKYSGEGK